MGDRRTHIVQSLGAVLSLLAFALGAARGQLIKDLERPGDAEFIRDLANMVEPADAEVITTLATALLREKATPIIVVTIESMARHGATDMRIETFATLLFDQWGIGHAELNGAEWNTGILLLVSKLDRKARIELGAGWGRGEDALCQEIIDGQIIPRFKAGDFSEGIRAGVSALDKMARGLELPKPHRPWWHHLILPAGIALLVFTIVSLIRRGSGGWAWLMWGAVFAFLGWLIISLLSNKRGGGGFGGGSFGGGFSGGGGATGGW